MDRSDHPVMLTGRHEDQCVRWNCRRVPFRPFEYCHESCQKMAASDSQSTLPFLLSYVYSSTTEFALIAGKIFNLIKAAKEPGVPQLSKDVLQIPPWLSSKFDVEFSAWETFRQWLFMGSSQLPATLDFNWVEERSKVVGQVRLRVLKPVPKEDNIWELHQYSSLDQMGEAVYVMRCNKFGEPLSDGEDEENEENEETDSD
ncbi:PREDICTED: uncharacterized protein LOC104784573 [Camelina sativa]|uniref:Uncharacterized protein LOC104784573 n=1 Tax=Camelina sativa TaxID=90675 RepID=A0ABM0YYH0_CAMSA|nr:PREDICTED: uncharacterized protein LOC104784573 [Camelina sativa]XP_010507914.1 PREDICTED: uncharacterized protein LOC104784573 [Camelina sativa]